MLNPSTLDAPSLAALRAFEAAARCGSFSTAAKELQVSPAAVAQHVKALEAWAQQPLFDRGARGVTLNQAGVRARPALTDAFHRLAIAAHQLRDGNIERRTVRVAALPAIAELWLTPRLAELRSHLPGVDFAIHAADNKPDLQRDGFDLAAYFEPVPANGDELVLVTSPDVAEGLVEPQVLDHTPRLVDLSWDNDWLRWSGPEIDPKTPVIEFSLFAMAVGAALRGEGALVGRRSLLQPHIETGTLVEPFERRVATGDAIRIQRRDDPALSPIDDWIAETL